MGSATDISTILTRSVADILPSPDLLKEKLTGTTPIRIYYGIDPTSTVVHLGNAIALHKLQQFVELGHHVIFLIGSFTAMIGDPSDKESARTMLSEEQVQKNLQSYVEQAGKILDISRVEVVYNHTWHKKLTLDTFLDILSKVTYQQLIERDLFQKRLETHSPLWMHELMYPLLQGYDSVVLDVDLEMGGTDQTFNMLMGRRLQEVYGKRNKCVLSIPLIPGLDGRKMSKSYGNTVNITDEPRDMYGKLMSMSDELIPVYAEHCSVLSFERVQDIAAALTQASAHPMELKKEVSGNIVAFYHGEEAAADAADFFTQTVQGKALPDTIETVSLDALPELSVLDVITLVDPKHRSRSDAKRLVYEGGTAVVQETGTEQILENPSLIGTIQSGSILRIGKHTYVRVVETAGVGNESGVDTNEQ